MPSRSLALLLFYYLLAQVHGWTLSYYGYREHTGHSSVTSVMFTQVEWGSYYLAGGNCGVQGVQGSLTLLLSSFTTDIDTVNISGSLIPLRPSRFLISQRLPHLVRSYLCVPTVPYVLIMAFQFRVSRSFSLAIC